MPLLPTDEKSRQQLRYLLIALPLLAAGAFWYLVYNDRKTEIATLTTQVEELQTKNDAAKALAARGGPELRKKVALYEQHVSRLEELIPKSEEVPDLLHDITMRAEESGVDLNLMRPEKSTAVDFYTRQVYSMSVMGPYEGVGRFMAAVGSLPRIVTPIHLKLLPRAELDRSGAVRLQAEFQIMTFVAPEGGSASAPAAPVKDGPKNVGK